MSQNSNILEVKNICKFFPGVKALDDVSFTMARGEVRGLNGENGAGKSTLIKIITGVYTHDTGEIIFDGNPVRFSSSKEAQDAGISTVYQEINLIPYLSVAENIYIGDFPMNKFGIDWRKLYQQAQELLDSLNLKVDPKTILNTLGAATQQMIAIARALRKSSCDLLIMDEPTSSLDTEEVKMLFSFIKRLKEKGVSFIFITHRLEEIFQICDSVTVLKDGKYVGTYPIEEMDLHKLVTYMVGHEIIDENTKGSSERCKANPTGEPIIKLDNVVCLPSVINMSFEVYSGEIVGLAGLLGSGRTETARLIYGCEKIEGGNIYVNGKLAKIKSPVQALNQKVAYCTENRRIDGIVPNMSVKNNTVFNNLQSISKFGIVSNKRRNEIVNFYIDRFMIKTPTAEQSIKYLSGGNQQKVMLARALATNPKLIILDEPTRGIDVGGKAEIEALMHEVAKKGIGVLFISSDIDEIVRNCDRVVVVRAGVSVGELSGDEISKANITKMISKSSDKVLAGETR